MPEFIKKQDGYQKQDCENAAVKRWLKKNPSQKYGHHVTLLGDDLYSHQPICNLALEKGHNFIFVCLKSSHQTVTVHSPPPKKQGKSRTKGDRYVH